MRFVVSIIESERGWFQRVDEEKFFDTYEKAAKFRDKFNAHNKETSVPDSYMYATNPVECR